MYKKWVSLFVVLCIGHNLFCQNDLYIHDTISQQEILTHHYYLTEQRLFSWVLARDINAINLNLQTRRTRLSGPIMIRFNNNIPDVFSIDSVICIPDSIERLKKLQKIAITGNGLSYISPNLSKLRCLKHLEIDNFGGRKEMLANLPILNYVKRAVILSSDSITVKKTLESLPNVKSIELHFEVHYKEQLQWNARNIFYQTQKLTRIIVPYWYGLEYASRQEIDYIDEQDTVYKRVYYLDFDLQHCKHLRKIVTDFELSKEMQKYCRKHFIKVVKFSRKRF